MTARPPTDDNTPKGVPGSVPQGKATRPEWADGLRQLYDSVVDEPLPDSFKELLAKLDKPAQGGKPMGGSEPE
ncbi:NepR family anti-sigma factor [Parerythrobacter aestuarii]|uniref:NepR family anti-sigma factor n=1 Tax=Parerythrobacter aestuarii TaxID=3020909 RepID=UPI0024DE5B5A|nr:NepR family anti-sigma factor [Parerythrobacter aestuarii]